MKTTRLSGLSVIILLFLACISIGQPTTGSAIPSEDAIRKILIERLGASSNQIGIVVGVIEPAGRRIIAYGSSGREGNSAVDGNTVFEIGSITKVFTSLLLADMAQHGEVSLTDPVAKYLPAGAKMPERGGRVITLEDLSRHRSGLPRLPTNLDAASNPQNPYASYSVKQLYEFLSDYQLTRDIDAQFEYSNLGGGLLGHVLGLAAGKDYETLILSRVCKPLGMNNTGITLSPELNLRLAMGHDGRFEPTSAWDLPTLAGAGALRSTANDMLSFLAAQLGYTKSDLDPAISATHGKRTPADSGMEIGLGWLMRPKRGSEIIWHNGGTGGYRTFAGFDPKARIGVVVLTNVSTPVGVDDLGFHLLDPDSQLIPANSPLLQPPPVHREIVLDSNTLDLYIGKYQFIPGMSMIITRLGNQLSAQMTGQGPAEIYPENKTDFFYKVVDAQILFKTDSQGHAEALVLRQLGRDQLAKRVEENADNIQEWFGHREKKVEPALFDNYVGRYQLPNNIVFRITREGDRLFVDQAQKLELFAESERVFFLKVADGQITFETDGTGPATAIILKQGGRDIRAPRISE
jgi:D-alanyl-D-alanine-carboxypeptidase/D-alanyl-D-alanine-endopeptidase